MYWGVPMATAVAVSVAGPVVEERAFAIPKSVTTTRPRLPSSDVVRLDVAMDDADRVRGAQRVGGLDHDAARLLRRQPATALEPGRERLPVDVRHHEVDEAVRPFADAVDRDNVRVGQPGGGLRLAQEPDADLLAEGELRREHLDGHLAFQALVSRLVHDAHPAAADLPFDRIGAAQRLAQAGHQRIVGLGHAVPRRGARIDLAARGRSCNLQKGLDLEDMTAPAAISFSGSDAPG